MGEHGRRRWRHGLAGKVFLLALACMLPVIAVLLGLTYWSIGQGFHRYVRATEWANVQPLAGVLERHYAEHGDWSFLPADPRLIEPWLRLSLDWARRSAAGYTQDPPPPSPLRDRAGWPQPGQRSRAQGLPPEGRPRDGRPPEGHPTERPPQVDQIGFVERVAVLDADGRRLTGAAGAVDTTDRRPLRHQDRIVGYLALQPGDALSEDLDHAFLSRQATSIAVIMGLAVLLSGLAGALMASHVRRPIGALLKGTAALADGGFATRLPEDRRDELGDLARSFNLLGEALGRHEQARREWVAASSHELRTPISVLRAQIEAMQDGVRPVNLNTVAVLHREVLALSKLVEDLYTLARADVGRVAYSFLPVEPLSLLDEVLDSFGPRLAAARLAVRWTARPAGQVVVDGDLTRLRQLLSNLMENTLRYTDPGGRLDIAAIIDGPVLRLRLDDTPPGVGQEELDRLFDRFYRSEGSRNRESGGSGLGLAICRGIAEAHDGTIGASPSPLGGLRVTLTLPLARDSR